MDIKLHEQQFGSEASMKVELLAGKLKLTVAYAGAGGGADVVAFVDSDYLIDKLAALIPGQVDDAIFSIIKASLKA